MSAFIDKWRDRFDTHHHLEVVVVPPEMWDEYYDDLAPTSRYANVSLRHLGLNTLQFQGTVIIKGG